MRYYNYIEEAAEIASDGSNNFGEGGRAAAMLYSEGKLTGPEHMLYTIAVLANRIGELEEAKAA